MARLYLTCSYFCVIFVFFFTINNSLAIHDTYYQYSPSISPFDNQLIEFKSLRPKREVVPPLIPAKPEAATPSAPIVIHHSINESLPADPAPPKQLLNLGENGHGIRKNFTVSDPISNDGSVPTPPSRPTTVPTKTNQTNDTDDQISITEFSDNVVDFNKTLRQHNITETRNDTHIYYNSTFTIDPNVANRYWVDMTNRSDVKINELLSKSHRRAATIKLRFDFPFYGHLVRNVTIATGGFLYTGEYVHSWLAATQYIAPLMANFDTSLHDYSFIKYVDNGTAFTVQWEKVSLQDRPESGQFTFQATLVNNGDIIFVYKNIPFVVEDIQDDNHPVKVGLSDAYIIDRTIFFVRRKTIYEYHRVNFRKKDIKNDTCTWCPSTQRCSNGLDRHRQDWFTKGCDRKQFSDESKCAQQGMDVYAYGPHGGIPKGDEDIHVGRNHTDDPSQMGPSGNHDLDDPHDLADRLKQSNFDLAKQSGHSFDEVMQSPRRSREKDGEAGSVSMGASGIIAILFMVVLVSGLGVWVLYAYRNPHTSSGQILIRNFRRSYLRYRPTQWRWKRGEARYTAATIHM